MSNCVDCVNLDASRLVEAYHANVYRYAYRLTGRVCDAEDLTQETFVQAIRHLDRLRDTDRAGAWLLTIARNCFLQSVRGTRSATVPWDESQERLSEETQEAAVDVEAVQMALDALSPEFRIVVLMHYFEELSYAEIATELQMPIGTVMSRLNRARSRLRAILAPRESAEPAVR